MATHDYVIANASGAAVRADLNNALAAIVTNNSNATEPATTYAFQWWADTTANQLKLRNAANDDWIVIQELDGTLLLEDGSVGAPALAFAADLDTGILRPGTNQLAIATNGVERAEFGTSEIVFNDGGEDLDFRVEGDTDANLLYVDAGNERVGIGTGSPDHKFDVNGEFGLFEGNSINFHDGAGNNSAQITSDGSDTLAFKSTSANTEIFRLDSGGRFLRGLTSARSIGSVGTHGTQIEGVGFANSSLSIFNNENAATGPFLSFGRSRGTTLGSETVVQNGDNLGRIEFCAADGTDTRSVGAAILSAIDGTPGANDVPGRMQFLTTADGASSPTERMRITAGGVVRIMCDNYGATPGAGNSGVQLANASTASVWAFNNTTAATHIVFANANGNIGSIQTSGSSTTYNTSSDYRLKENVVDISDGITRVKQLAPKRFNFIADADIILDGFLAHEAQTVIPEAVTGTKDAVDDEGNPVYQGIDQSKLVPLLTAALQEAITKIEILEAKVAALEAA